MIKKLTKHGNSYALVIDKPIMELLGIDPNTPLEVVTNGRGLYVEPAGSKSGRRKFEQVREKMHRKYGDAFRRLAE